MRSANTICRFVFSRMHLSLTYVILALKVLKWRLVIIWSPERNHVWVTFAGPYKMKRKLILFINNNWVKNMTKLKKVPNVYDISHNKQSFSKRRWMKYIKETQLQSYLPSKYNLLLWALCSICLTLLMAFFSFNSGINYLLDFSYIFLLFLLFVNLFFIHFIICLVLKKLRAWRGNWLQKRMVLKILLKRCLKLMVCYLM